MKLHRHISFALLLALATAGCPSGPTTPQGGGPTGPTTGPTQVTEETRSSFTDAVRRFLDTRRANAAARQDWTHEQCQQVADLFQQISDDADSGVVEAIYARGVTFQQCGMRDEALAAFRKALELKANYPPALIQLGLYAMLDGNNDQAEQYFNKAYTADITAYQAYINLAVLAFDRGLFRPAGQEAAGGPQTQIGNALAIQGDSIVALENLARFFFDYSQQSEQNQRFRRFALLVCEYARTKNPLYAPIYNLRGLIYLAEQNIRAAISDFRKASELDPDFYEAYMNYASLNLGFRGYQQAYDAYTQALRVRPTSYDALIGLGVAIRGLASDQEANEADGDMVEGTHYTYDMAIEKYKAAEQVDPNRPEAYYNIALIQHRFTNITGPEQYDPAIASYQQALSHCQNVAANDSGVDYHQLLSDIQDNLDKAQKDKETLVHMQEMEAQAAAVQAQADAAAAAQAAADAAAAAAAAAQHPATPEGGGTTAPAGGGTTAPEGGGTAAPAEGGGAAAPEGGAPANPPAGGAAP